MAIIQPPATPCNQYKKYRLTFAVPAIPPQNGYLVRWKYLGKTSWEYEQVTEAPLGIIDITVPVCDAIYGEVLPFCGRDNLGGAIYGTPKPFSIAPSATYTASMTQASCVLGVATYNISGGKAGETVVLRLTVTGNAVHNTTSGNCAWITTEISDTTATTVNKISSAINDVMTNQSLTSDIVITLNNTGSALIQTKVFAYNLLGNGGLSGTLQVISIGGNTPTTPISLTACIGYQQQIGCAPDNG